MQAAGNAVLFEAESEMAVANHTWCLERRLTRWSLNQGTYDIIIGEKRRANIRRRRQSDYPTKESKWRCGQTVTTVLYLLTCRVGRHSRLMKKYDEYV